MCMLYVCDMLYYRLKHLLLPCIGLECNMSYVTRRNSYHTWQMNVDIKNLHQSKSLLAYSHTLVIGPSQLRNFNRTTFIQKKNNKFDFKAFCLETNSSIYFVHIEMDAIDFTLLLLLFLLMLCCYYSYFFYVMLALIYSTH